MKNAVLIFVFTMTAVALSAGGVGAQEGIEDSSGSLTREQIERVKACQQALAEVDDKPVSRRVEDLESTELTEENLQILEAMTATYTEVVSEHKVTKLSSRKRLWNMIELNMAYLQLGGALDPDMIPDPLNQLICRKLRKHLSAEILNNPVLFQKLS